MDASTEESGKPELVMSRHNGPLLLNNGFLFMRDKISRNQPNKRKSKSDSDCNEKHYWRCIEKRMNKSTKSCTNCLCRLVTDNEGNVISTSNEHNHESDPVLIEKYNFEFAVKQRLLDADSNEDIAKVLDEELAKRTDRLREVIDIPKYTAYLRLHRNRNLQKQKKENIEQLKKLALANPSLPIDPKQFETQKTVRCFNSIEPEYIPVLRLVKNSIPYIHFDGYVYNRNKTVSTLTYWRCLEYDDIKCPARLSLDNDKIVSQTGDHNHVRDPLQVEKLRLDYEMRISACHSDDKISDIIEKAMNDHSDLKDLYDLPNLDHTLARIRRDYRKKTGTYVPPSNSKEGRKNKKRKTKSHEPQPRVQLDVGTMLEQTYTLTTANNSFQTDDQINFVINTAIHY